MEQQLFETQVKMWRMNNPIFWNFHNLTYQQLLTLNISDKHVFGWIAKSRLLRQIGIQKKKYSKKERMVAQKEAELSFKRIKLINPILVK
jgi:hypothetical protein